MNLSDLPLVGMLQKKMSWLNERQSILARNIANASTPGFVPKDLREADFAAALKESGQGGMMTTNSMHIRAASAAGGVFRAINTPDSQSSPDGNAVVVEEQMLKVADTQASYAQATGLYKKMTSMWRTALGGPSA